ncbi:MAG: hypothetical protein AABX93_02660 [Nanoarchaeota archaeon]
MEKYFKLWVHNLPEDGFKIVNSSLEFLAGKDFNVIEKFNGKFKSVSDRTLSVNSDLDGREVTYHIRDRAYIQEPYAREIDLWDGEEGSNYQIVVNELFTQKQVDEMIEESLRKESEKGLVGGYFTGREINI